MYNGTNTQFLENFERGFTLSLIHIYSFTISITIKDKKGEMKVDTNAGVQNVNQVIKLEVDQKAKTLVSENEYGKAEITYQVSGNVLTIKDVKNSLMGDTDMFNNYMKIAKFKKVK